MRGGEGERLFGLGDVARSFAFSDLGIVVEELFADIAGADNR